MRTVIVVVPCNQPSQRLVKKEQIADLSDPRLRRDLERSPVLSAVGCPQHHCNPSIQIVRNAICAGDPTNFRVKEKYFARELQSG